MKDYLEKQSKHTTTCLTDIPKKMKVSSVNHNGGFTLLIFAYQLMHHLCVCLQLLKVPIQ